MPNGKAHRRLGAAAGGAAALYEAREEPLRDLCFEAMGGVVGGILGGVLPDRFDTPTSPRHRGAYHSVILLIVVALLLLDEQRRICRQRAHAAMRVGPVGLEATFRSDAWFFATGFITGLQWGYVSHLGADLLTGKAGLPLLARGF
jgi:membrane-bound metal-dependent hydrolase YbcI (DUF457 family)